MTITRSLLLSASLVLTPIGAAQANDFKTLIQAQSQSSVVQTTPQDVPYSYLVTIEMDSVENNDVEEEEEETESFRGQYRFNPAAAPGERVTIVNGKWDDYPKDMRKELDKVNNDHTIADFVDEFWCVNDADIYSVLRSDLVSVLREDESEVVISLNPDAIAKIMAVEEGEGERQMPKKIRKRMLGELTLAKPGLTVKHSRFWLSRPTTLKIVAKMKEMNFEQSCSIAPNGLPFVSQNNTRVSGKAMGSAFGMDLKVSLSDLQPN